jgi:Flp pilus assembly protein TadG
MFMRKTYTSIRGSAIVEFALVIPLLILLITAMMDVARYYFIEQSMSHTVRAAARVAVTGQVDENPDYDPNNPSSDEFLSRRETIINAARRENPGSLRIVANDSSNQPSDTLQITPADGGDPGDEVTVNLTQNFTFCTPLLEHLIHDKGHSGVFTLSVTTTYKNEVFDED